jgi:hypothetical protein
MEFLSEPTMILSSEWRNEEQKKVQDTNHRTLRTKSGIKKPASQNNNWTTKQANTIVVVWQY